MFDNLNKQPEDIFAQTDKSAPQVPPPTAPVSDSSAPPSLDPQTIQQRVAEMSAQQRAQGGGGGLKVAIIVLSILVVIGGAFFISWRILTSKTPVTPAAPGSDVVSEVEEDVQPTPEPEPTTEPEPVVDVDSDSDGLSDAQEAGLGTSATMSDTDEDGLFDREEVEVYSTDPLNPDSDGDTYLDGAEVKGGYDPNGPGKLLQVPSGS